MKYFAALNVAPNWSKCAARWVTNRSHWRSVRIRNLGVVLALLFFCLARPAAAQIAYKQSNFSSLASGSSATVTYSGAQSAGDLNVVMISWIGSSSISAVSDSAGNTYSLALGPTQYSAGSATQYTYYAKNIAASSSNTVTVTMSGAVGCCLDVRIAEYSGIATTSPLDGAVGASGTAATMSSGSITTTNANDLLVGGNFVSGATAGPGTGYTQRLLTTFSSILEDETVGSTGSYAATAPQVDTGWWIMQLVAFKGATGGAPTAPTSLTATAASSSQINLSWTASTGGVGGVSGYLVERCTGSGCTSFVQIAGPTTTSYSDSGLTASTTYTYRVRAVDTAGNDSGYSNTAAATTSASGSGSITYKQSNFSSLASGSSAAVAYSSAQSAGDLNVVMISWIGSSSISAVSDSAGNTYSLALGPTQYSAGSATQYTYYAKNIAASSSNTVTVTMSAAVGCCLDVRIAEYSGIVTTSPLDNAIGASGTATTMSSGSITTTNANDLLIGGNFVSGGTAGPGTGYTQRLLTTFSSILEDEAVASTGSYAATAPQVDTGWWIMQLVAFKGGSGGSAPSAPSGATATAVSSSQINLSWTASTGGVGGVSGYRVERCTGSGCTNFAQIGTPTVTSYSDSGLAASTTYTYRVRAADTASDLSAYSGTPAATTGSGSSSSSSSSGGSSGGGSGSSSSSSSGGSSSGSGSSGASSGGTCSIGGVSTYTYNTSGQLHTVSNSGGCTVTYSYDANGNVLSVQ